MEPSVNWYVTRKQSIMASAALFAVIKLNTPTSIRMTPITQWPENTKVFLPKYLAGNMAPKAPLNVARPIRTVPNLVEIEPCILLSIVVEYHDIALTPVNCPNIINPTQNQVALQYWSPNTASLRGIFKPFLGLELVYLMYWRISSWFSLWW